mgnify:FL=1
MRSVITVTGEDAVGIIARVSGYLASNGINIVDISQTTHQNKFLMVMLVDMDGSEVVFSRAVKELKELGLKIGQRINMRHEQVFNSMHRI